MDLFFEDGSIVAVFKLGLEFVVGGIVRDAVAAAARLASVVGVIFEFVHRATPMVGLLFSAGVIWLCCVNLDGMDGIYKGMQGKIRAVKIIYIKTRDDI